MRIFLVRHADAGDRERWNEDDRLRPLSDKGWTQANGLVTVLEGESIGTVLSSPYLRCIQTVEPVATARGLAVEPEPSLEEGADWRRARRLMTTATVPTVMCSQGDVIAAIVMDLVGNGLAARDARWQKGSTWALDIERGEVLSARYLLPLKV